MIGFRQQLSTTSFEACELEITVNYFCVHLNREWQFHAKSNELTDAFLAFLLTEHKVIHCYVTNAVYCCLAARQLYRLVASVQQTFDASNFPTLVGQFIQQPSYSRNMY